MSIRPTWIASADPIGFIQGISNRSGSPQVDAPDCDPVPATNPGIQALSNVSRPLTLQETTLPDSLLCCPILDGSMMRPG
ncbi:MAG: hypothetical protein OSB12_05760 [Planctomycetota bacterium]|nr:hypothetical protein [Planctomycetota bacterium]